ncbi:DUF3800 domain-containing protein [Candidatus Saccharibacteria bacterium]|nr:DUF3800 domain-containing protein [Candidatus Saccharibacteria bacterium]
MKKQLVFIDDSGDPGLKKGSSTHFVMACAVFMSDEVAEQVAAEFKKFRKDRNLKEDYEFKFYTTDKGLVEKLLTIVAKYDFTINAIYLDKSNPKHKDLLYLVPQPKLYNWAIKELLSKLPLKDARIRIDGRSSKRYMQGTKTYLRQELNKNSHKILNIKFEDSMKNDLIQLADLVAGSVNRSLQKDKSDSRNCLKIIKSKIDSIEGV